MVAGLSLEERCKELAELRRRDRKTFVARRERVIQSLDDCELGDFIKLFFLENKKEFPIPEFLGTEEVFDLFGYLVYEKLGITGERPQDLLDTVFEDYGVLDDEKCQIYLKEKQKNSRGRKLEVFWKKKEHAPQNAKTLVKYAWEHVWKGQYGIPELVTMNDIEETIGSTVYAPLGLRIRSSNALLRILFPNYGILNDDKCKVFFERTDITSRKRMEVFWDGHRAEGNARKAINYMWRNVWKPKYKIPELITEEDITNSVGNGIYRALRIRGKNSKEVLKKIFPHYGVLDEEKCRVYERKKDFRSREIMVVFWSGKYTKRNTETMLYYIWQKYWRGSACLEDIPREDIKERVGHGLYDTLGGENKYVVATLRKVLKERGIETT
ncbi:hypothetical protein HZC31_05905 [Candidatus Woesearchaeota archaeon]|nr:hypothetical protein [Candidatus Woesearchaeota archaeon]